MAKLDKHIGKTHDSKAYFPILLGNGFNFRQRITVDVHHIIKKMNRLLNRVAELLAGPRFAGDGRQPVSDPVIDLTIRRVLAETPGMFESVADHPSTIVALRKLHHDLRLGGDHAATALEATRRGCEAVRVSRAVTRILTRRWYDEADLFAAATAILTEAAQWFGHRLGEDRPPGRRGRPRRHRSARLA